uniref:Uncharacterized protein AlNc14C70G4839 n=1 Tax=Albugo laibachii Nc14 TaxID=890382 RepID=F0WDX0_9STRA|nr:conserved hypothetical protein [Albugo laibachii Nc14]|eukprot:CCA19398.1 conserved hypothetical protein [Albugo laibachii Nc14]
MESTSRKLPSSPIKYSLKRTISKCHFGPPSPCNDALALKRKVLAADDITANKHTANNVMVYNTTPVLLSRAPRYYCLEEYDDDLSDTEGPTRDMVNENFLAEDYVDSSCSEWDDTQSPQTEGGTISTFTETPRIHSSSHQGVVDRTHKSGVSTSTLSATSTFIESCASLHAFFSGSSRACDSVSRELMSEGRYLSDNEAIYHMTATNVCVLVLEYVHEVLELTQDISTMTFAQLGSAMQSLPNKAEAIQCVVASRLHLPMHFAQRFVLHIIEFIDDEDIWEATIYEFASFLREFVESLRSNWNPTVGLIRNSNVLENLMEFFCYVSKNFKRYLVTRWLASRRISAPCEFGKKSDALFLCMECHREHM